MHRVALYARVSSPRQEKEETIESQLEQLLTHARQQQWTIPAELQFIDKAVSGEHLVRPALDRLRDTALVGGFQTLLCCHVDRLARNLGAQYVLFDELERAGVKVRFLQEPDLGDSAQAKLLRNVQGAFAEYERVLLQERMRRGRLYRLRHGQSVPTQAPYGYRFQGAIAGQRSHWVVLADEAAVVAQIYAWYNAGRWTLGDIERQLNSQGTPSPEGKNWSAGTLGRLMRQPAYYGTAYYGRHRADYTARGQMRVQGRGRLQSPRYVSRPPEEWIAVSVPALVSEEVWVAAQERLQMNARYSPRNSRHQYLLRSLLVCGTCGHTLQGRCARGRICYTCTYGAAKCPPGVPRHRCWLRAEVGETLIWDALTGLLADPGRVRQAWEAFNAEEAGALGEVSRFEQRASLLAKQRKRLVDAYQADLLTLEDLAQRQPPIDAELRELQRQIDAAPQRQPTQIALEVFTHRIHQALSAPDFETKQEVLRLLIERVTVTDTELTVEHIVPTEPAVCRLDRTLRDE